MTFFGNDYTEEEQRGIDKYLWRRFVFGMAAAGVMLVLILAGYACSGTAIACSQSRYGGTWILEEDYADGFDGDDRVLEFRYEENRYGDNVFALYIDGSREGEARSGVRGIEVDAEKIIHSYFVKRDVTYRLFPDKDRMTLEYEDYEYTESPDVISSVIGGEFDITYPIPEIREFEVTETYIRISEKTGLTEEQRDALY